jgi:uncharacterized CHY-type Zn-finger protein
MEYAPNSAVLPKVIYNAPQGVVTLWLKTWALNCGKCEKDFVKFAWFARPKCPYCGTKNNPTTGYMMFL